MDLVYLRYCITLNMCFSSSPFQVNSVAEEMNELRSSLEGQNEKLRVELSTTKQAKTQLELHNKQLLDRIADVEQKEVRLKVETSRVIALLM